MEYERTDTHLGVKASLEVEAHGGGKRWGGSAKLNVSASYQKSTTQGSNVQRTYSLDIHVKAVQDDLPAGMEKILGILENAMQAQPAKLPPPVVAT
jgi:hypothetical protein